MFHFSRGGRKTNRFSHILSEGGGQEPETTCPHGCMHGHISSFNIESGRGMGTSISTLNLGRGVGTNIEVGVRGGGRMNINVRCLVQPLQYFVLLLWAAFASSLLFNTMRVSKTHLNSCMSQCAPGCCNFCKRFLICTIGIHESLG